MQKKILLVDDAQDMHLFCRKIITNAGYTFNSAFDGIEGLTKLETFNPDLVLLDFMMPNLNGHQVYEKIMTDDSYKNFRAIPFIILTAADTKKNVRRKFLKMGLAAYLNKPFGANELINIIDNILITNKLKVKNRRLHEVTQKAKDFLENLIESSPDAIITINLNGRISYISRGAEEMLGYDAREIYDKKLINYCAESFDLDYIFLQMKKLSKIKHQQTSLYSKDGNQIPVSFSISVLLDKNNTIAGYLLIAKDLSEIKRLEKELLEKERLSTLMETAAAINHEINNPLTPILGNIQLILSERKDIDPWLLDKLITIEKNAWRVHHVIQKLRSITQPVTTNYFGEVDMIDIKKSK